MNHKVNESHYSSLDPQEVENRENSEESIKKPPCYILPAIVASQFGGTALWFAGNAVLPDLVEQWDIPESSLSYMTSSVQFGFIVGTLSFAVLNVADWFSPTRVFGVSALVGATLNAMIPFWPSLAGLILLRLGTGFSLAGIYPVGMKVVADWFPKPGKALGFLVGALALGSATPFLLRQIPQCWEALVWETSALALTSGILVATCIPNGPHRKPSERMGDPSVVYTLFRTNIPFRDAALGYFGHMWELYAFWTWCPVVWEAYLSNQSLVNWDASAITFAVVAIGGLGCILGGLASERYGSALVASCSLAISGLLCFLSPALFLAPPPITLILYLIWGMAVIADSAQFSSLVAQACPPENKGTALTIVNCIGFTVTIGSIQLLGVLLEEKYLFLLLAPGPVFGLCTMRSHILGMPHKKDKQEDYVAGIVDSSQAPQTEHTTSVEPQV